VTAPVGELADAVAALPRAQQRADQATAAKTAAERRPGSGDRPVRCPRPGRSFMIVVDFMRYV